MQIPQTLRAFASRLFKWAIILGVAGAVVYYLKFRPIPVVSYKISSGTIVAQTMGTGTLEAKIRTTISSKIQGRLVALLADQNDRVKKDQLLVRLDDTELKQQVEVAKAKLEVAKASVERLRADEERAKALLDQAKRDLQRANTLSSNKIASASEIEKYSAQVSVAEADLKHSLASVSESMKNIAAEEENLRYYETKLADCKIVAPFDGLIVRRDREVGDMVTSGVSILQLVSTDELWISAWIDETGMASLTVKLPARIVFRSEPDKEYAGDVARMGREVDRETREFIVDVHVATLPPNWAVGQRAEVWIETQHKSNALLLPLSFITYQKNLPGVFVAENGTAHWKPIKFGLRGKNVVEVVEGVQEGCIVITAADPTQSSKLSGHKIQEIKP